MKTYLDSNIECSIILKNGTCVKRTMEWSFLMTKFIDELYNEYNDNWKYFIANFSDTGNPYGKISNTEETKQLRSKELEKVNFDCIVENDFLIDCELYLKSEPSNPRQYTITKEELLNKFVQDMDDLHGRDWEYFNTCFNDSGQVAYGTINNTSHLRRTNKLTPSGLKQRRYALNRAKWEDEKNNRVEIFYVLVFKDSGFLKIGNTFRDIEYRLYNYIFPRSDREKKIYDGRIIDFEKSFIVKTTKKRIDISNKIEYSLESKFKEILKDYRFTNSKEILKIECLSEIKVYLEKLGYLEKTSLLEYTGFEDGNEMKIYNVEKGVYENAYRFYSRKSNPTLYLKNKYEK